ncbi:hypothetical protein CALVIDRAFT_568148 [Calocera viscosa TUFC12733]|uniref:Uncharacterized protein n=1 Tax=Calocera viscosa (strain TUFC12733) TaxID=1330018 RepID=A0A167HG01_CALVF|nr:hypothetical protein CALVIDRAFT_568148 [Calocera viscosa TUFC12733]
MDGRHSRIRSPRQRQAHASPSSPSRPASHSTDTTPSLTDSDSNSLETDGRPPRSPPPHHVFQQHSIHYIDNATGKLGFSPAKTPLQMPVNFEGHAYRPESPYSRSQTPSTTTAARIPSPVLRDRRRSRDSSTRSFYLAVTSLPDLLSNHRILTRLLANGLVLGDVVALMQTCRKAREALCNDGEAREIIFERTIPGYRRRISEFTRVEEVSVTMADYELLGDALAMPLHRYPTHALHVLSIPHPMTPSREAQHATLYLEALTQAHSRFVLLLRGRGPRWSLQLELDDPSWLISNGGGANALRQNTNLWHRPPPREIVFPTPLWATDGGIMSQSQSVTPSPTSPSSSNRNLSKRRPSLLIGLTRSNSKLPPPPPNPVPAALSYYRQPPLSAPPQRKPSFSRSLDSFVAGPTFPGLPPFGHSASNSISYPPPGSSAQSWPRSSPSPPFTTPSPPSPTGSGSDYSPPSTSQITLPPMLPHSQSWASHGLPPITSPHDLHLACLPTRAPIVRVFVPCTTLSSSALFACEGQLVTSGLWNFLRQGDVVCNLGYIPLTGSKSPSPESSSSEFPADPTQMDDDAPRGWLLFTGASLVPYFPPSPPPLSSPLSLTTPTYYTHLSASAPRFLLTLPAKPIDPPTLQPSILALPAPHLGANVKIQVWRARITVPADMVVYPDDSMQGTRIGAGWAGEWVVESDGTKEGLNALMDAEEGGQRVWEVVKARSRPGRVWLR